MAEKEDKRKTRWARISEQEREAFRKTMRKAMRKKFKDPVYRKMMRESKQTSEFRKLRSTVMKRNHKNPEFRKKMVENNYQNAEVKSRQGKKFSENWDVKPEEERQAFREERSRLAKKQLSDPAKRKTMNEANWQNPEVSARRAKTFKETWSKKPAEEIREFAEKVYRKGAHAPNKHELKILSILKGAKLDYRFVGDGKVFVAGHCPDFLHKTHNLIIEYDNNYWHSRPGRKESDKKRNSDYRKRGYKVLILKTEDLKDEKRLLNKIVIFEAKYKTPATRRPSSKKR